MRKANPDAVRQFALGALAKPPPDVPPGTHNLSNIQLVMTFPALAAVTRAEGTAGGGFNAGQPAAPAPAPELSLDAVLFYVQSFTGEHYHDQRTPALDVWRDCVRRAAQGETAERPSGAVLALTELQAELPALPAQEPTRTPAKRTGAEEVQISYKRLPKAKAKVSP